MKNNLAAQFKAQREKKEINAKAQQDLAKRYREFGFNISCITNTYNIYNEYSRSFFKTPSHPWIHFFDTKQNLSEIENYDWQNSVGIGTFTKWNDLVVIDIDGCSDITFLEKILKKLDLPKNYEWVVESGSKNGYHIYYRGGKIKECKSNDVVSTFPPKENIEKYLDKIEFLWETHTVLPPSVHGSGNIYSFLNTDFPKKPPISIPEESIYNLIESFFEFSKIEGGNGYGEILTSISSKTEFINDFEETDITKFLLNEVYLFLDIETSGLPYKDNSGTTKYPEIIQISWLLTSEEGVILKKYSFIIDTPFIRKASDFNFVNINFDVAKKVKFPIDYVFQKLAVDIKICDLVVAHNVEFDSEVLGFHFIKEYGFDPFKIKRMVCTMKSTIDFCKIPSNSYGYKYPKMSELYFKLFGYHIKNSHNAEIDVLHTLKCFKKLKSLGKI